MKKLFYSLAFAAVALLAACGGGPASAAPLPFNFTATNGVNFSVAHASSIEQVTGGIKVTKMVSDQDGITVASSRAYADSNGSVFAKFQAVAASTGLFLRVGTSTRYVGAEAPAESSCFGPNTMLTYTEGIASFTESVNDGCVISQGIKAISQ